MLSLFLSSLLLAVPALAVNSLSSLTASYNLNSAVYNFSFPTDTLNSADTSNWVMQNWELDGRIAFGNSDIVFSPDPSTSSSTLVRRKSSTRTSSSASTSSMSSTASASTASASTDSASSNGTVTYPNSTNLDGQPPVLRVEYPQGSFSKATGGTQFYASPLNTSGTSTSTSDGQYERMLLSYDVWFPSGYAWNMGGKLPGLRGGPDRLGCSGGNETDGTGCFSTRVMWRTNGAGEVYAYIPTTATGFCSEANIICNSDYGTSLDRGSFTFVTGQWQTIWLMVILNEVGTANGVVQLWYNGVQALSFTNLELRSASSIPSVGGLFFSTFFGGDDSTWATSTTQYSYFRNMQLFAGLGSANGTGSSRSAAGRGVAGGWSLVLELGGMLLLGLVGGMGSW